MFYAIFEGVSGETVVQKFISRFERDSAITEHTSPMMGGGNYFASAITRCQFEREIRNGAQRVDALPLREEEEEDLQEQLEWEAAQ